MQMKVFLTGVTEIVKSNPEYKEGGDGSSGICDCIGLIIGAIRRSGGRWTGTHGSNYAARHQMISLARDPPLELGTILFKAREPGDAGYALPDTYARHPDRRDYYHVGLVTSVHPLQITHCTSWSGGSGIKVDTVIGKWRYGGRLKGLEHERKEEKPVSEVISTATVIAESGSFVRLRVTPSIKAVAIANVAIGAKVSIIEKGDLWWRIQYGGKTGWMLAEFLDEGEPDAETPDTPESEPDSEMVQIPRVDWEAFLEAMERVLQGVVSS